MKRLRKSVWKRGILISFIALFCIVSCKSAKKEAVLQEDTVVLQDQGDGFEGQPAPEEEAGTNVAIAAIAEADGGERGQTKAEKRAARAAEEEVIERKVDPYTGWVYIPEKDFSITNGDVKIEMNGKTGSFCLYAIPEQGEPIALLSTYDSFSATFFCIRIGNKEYRLNRENGVTSEARRTPYGGQMVYTIKKQAQLVVDFSFLPSIATSSRVDMVRVTVYIINIGKNTQSFAAKAVFDTVLGENTPAHFSTAAHSRINTEKQYVSMQEDLWVRSANDWAALQFLLEGKGITKPDCVTLSNKDVLAGSRWTPSIQEERSFNSVLAYNNSALGINWPSVYLDPLKFDIMTFYLSVATDGNEPAGKDFLAQLALGKTALSASNAPEYVTRTSTVTPSPKPLDSGSLETHYWENMPPVATDDDAWLRGRETRPVDAGEADGGLTEYAPGQEKPLATEENEPSIHITDAQLDPAYIQRLLDHIASLENTPSMINEAELMYLNDELDAILTKLGSMN